MMTRWCGRRKGAKREAELLAGLVAAGGTQGLGEHLD